MDKIMVCCYTTHLLHSIEQDISLKMGNNVTQMATTSSPSVPYYFHKISKTKSQIDCHMYSIALGHSLTNSVFEFLNRRWAVGEDLVLHVAPDEEVARCRVTRSRWIIVITYSIKVFLENIDGFVACVSRSSVVFF